MLNEALGVRDNLNPNFHVSFYTPRSFSNPINKNIKSVGSTSSFVCPYTFFAKYFFISQDMYNMVENDMAHFFQEINLV